MATTMVVANLVRKGQLNRRGQPAPEHLVTIHVSNGGFEDLPGQVADAVTLLLRHEAALSALMQSHSVTEACLDFPIYSRLSGHIAVQYDHLPKALIQIAGRLGLSIEISTFPRPSSEGRSE